MAASDFELDDTLFAAPAAKGKPDAAPAPQMELDDNLFASPEPKRKDEPGFFGNAGRAFAAGAVGATADAVQGGQDIGVLAAGTDLSPQDRANAAGVDTVRNTLRSTADSLVDGMSDSAKRALGAKLWGADRSKGERNVWDSDVSLKEALATKMAQGLGSLLPSMGAALLGGIPGGSAAAGAMGAGGFTKDLRDLFGKMSDDDLRQNIPEFSEYIDAGIPSKEAREMLIQGAIGNKAVAQFLASGALATIGVEGMVGAGTLGRGGLGAALGRAAKGEAVNEFLDQGTQEGSKRLAIRDYEKRNSLPLSDPDISGALEASVQAGILGGLTGGAVGGVGHAVSGRRGKEPAVGEKDGATVGAVDPDTAAGLETATGDAAQAAPDMTAPEVSQPPAVATPAPAPVEGPVQLDAPPAAPDAVLDEDPDAEPMASPAPQPVADPIAGMLEPTPEVTAPPSDDVTARLDSTEASLADIGAQIESLVTPVVEQPRQQPAGDQSTVERVDAVGRQLEQLDRDLKGTPEASSDTPRGPRILRSLEDEAAEKKSNQLNRARVSASEATRVVRGENTATKLASDPEQLGSREDRQAIKRIIDRAIAAGVKPEEMTDSWRTMAETAGARKKDQRDAWMAARRAVHDETVSQVYSGDAVTEDAAAVATRQERERKAEAERTAADITAEMPLVTGRAIGDGQATLAVINSMMTLAQERGVDLSGRTDDRAATVFLRDAQTLGNELRAGKNVSMERLVQFAADAAAVKDDPSAFMASRRATSDEQARAAGIERNVSLDANEGVANAVAATPDDRQVERAPARRRIAPKPVAAPEQDNSTVTAGEDKAGKFAVATKRRRPVAPTSQAQAEAGNYPKGHRKFMGHDVTVETARGQKRRGPGWEVTMPVDYGYIKRTTGADGDQVDVFLGPSQLAKQVFMINQQNLDGSFDEHKVMLGFPSEDAARRAYEASFSDGRGADRIQSIVPMSRTEFSEWLKGDTVSAFNPDMATTLEETSNAPELPRIRASSPAAAPLTATGWSRLINSWAGKGRERTSAQIRAMAMGAATGRDMVRRAMAADNGPIFNTVSRQLGPILERIAGHVPVYVLSPEAMVALTVDDTIIPNGWTAAPEGFYSRDEQGRQYVALRSDMLDGGEGQTRLVLHEMLHAAVHDIIESNPVEMARIQNMLDTVKAQLSPDDYYYGLTNPHEFISEAFSNPDFQELLRVTPATQGLSIQLNPNRSMWSEFVASMSRLVNSMLQFIGISSAPSRNMLEMAMLQGERLLDIAERRPPPFRLQQGGPAALAPRMTAEQVTDRGNALTTKARRGLTRLMTLDQLRQSGEGLFTRDGTDWLNEAVSGMLQIDQTAERYAQEGAQLTQKYVEAIRNHRERMADYGDLAVDVTSMDVKMLNDPNWTEKKLEEHNRHLSKTSAADRQRWAQLEGLQKRFMSLPAELRTLWEDSQGFFAKTRTDTARSVAQSVLQARDGLTMQQRTGLVARALAGTLDEADRTLLGPTMFNDLAKARLIKGTEGDYFPLMRRGEHVVVTHLNRGDLMGGREVEPGVVEFKAADDKAARAAFNRFADATNLPITAVRRRYYLRETGEAIPAADAAGQDVDVAYRAHIQTQGVQFFESMADAREFARAAKASKEYTSVSEVLQRKDWYSQDDLSSSQLASLLGAVERRPDLGEQQKVEMRIAIYEAAARMMSGTRVQQRSIARRMVKGASADMARAVHDYTAAASGYIARMQHMPAVREAMSEMRKVQQEDLMGAGRQRGSEILNELAARLAVNDGNVTPPGKFLRDLMTLTFMARLFSPAYSLINAMQVAMVAYPTLAGRFGELKAAGAINRAYVDMGAGGVIARGVTNTASAIRAWSNDTFDASDPLASARAALAKRKDGAALVKVLDELEAVGLVGNDSGMEVAHASLRGRGRWGTGLARMDRIGRQLPTAVEVMNRVVTAVAAYRLAVGSGMTAEQATAHARDMVANTQGDYSARNAPPIFNTTLGRLSLQFKKYGQMMYYLIGRMVHDAFKGATPQERAIGRRQLLNLAAVQLAMAGAFSLPGLEIVKFVGIISGMLGFGDDDDAKKWLTKVMADSIGKTPAELISKGILSRAAGVDLSQRMSLSDMILFGEPENYDRGSMESYILRLLTGAGPGFIGDWYTGYKNAADGEWQKAFERFVPAKIAADTSRAARAYFGEEINEAEAFIKAMGLQPATLANKNEKIGERVKAQRQLPAERRALEKKFLRADKGDERAVMKEIADFNARSGFRNKIFPKQLAARKKMGEKAYRKMMDEKNRQREEQD